MLEVRQLRCERNDRLLFDNLSFSAKPGQLLRIAGGNGAGKTTLLRILCGLYDDHEGEVDWDLPGWPVYVGHKPGVKDLLTPVENLAWLCELHGSEPGMASIDHALESVALGAVRNRPCGTLSEGQRKRVNLARLFLLESPAWILDEPFSAIDAAGVERLRGAIAGQLASGGLVLLTSHQAIDVPGEEVVIELEPH